MSKITRLFIVFSVLIISSCSLTDLDLLDDPNSVTPENAQTDLFFNAIQLDVKDLFMNGNDLTSRVSRQLAMTGGNVYENAFAATNFNFLWRKAYADLLPDLDQLIEIAESEESSVPHYAGAAKLLKAYTLMTVVDMFGDVPYTEAGQGTANLSPNADNQSDIYNTALTLINDGIADLAMESPSIAGADLFYGGDATKWTKFGNTLLIKWYLNVGSGSNANGAEISAAAANAITDPADDFQFNFGTQRDAPDSRHWWYQDGYENGAGIYQSNYFMWSLKEEKGIVDPRINYYFYRQDLTAVSEIDPFTLDCGGGNAPLHYGVDQPYCHVGDGYWGRDHGNDDGIPPDDDRRTVAGIYPAGGLYDSGQGASAANSGADGAMGAGIAPIMLSSYTHFMLAEAALTRNTGDDAWTLLKAGIEQSMDKVFAMGEAQVDSIPDVAVVDAYVAVVKDRFDNASDKLDVVMKEYHIALWGNGIEAYNGYRRTTFPSNLQPTLEVSSGDFPRLMYYPADYLNLNANISAQRALTDQVFWDKNPAGAIK